MGKGMGDLARIKSFDESEKDEMYRASLKKNVHFVFSQRWRRWRILRAFSFIIYDGTLDRDRPCICNVDI